MHAAFFRPGGISQDLPKGLLREIHVFTTKFQSRIDELEELLTNNRIWKKRLKNVGNISAIISKDNSFSGVLGRSAGILLDLRKEFPYEVYNNLQFEVPLGKTGDSYDRYLIRIQEMRQSIFIIQQCLNLIPNGFVNTLSQNLWSSSMENLIQQFKEKTLGFFVQMGTTYLAVEAPKGELAVYLTSNNEKRPFRCKIRSPGFLHLQGMETMTKNQFLADIVTVIGTQDIVFGEVDR
jgi:NADH dehydrogenase (ubiquinone) Fe-S protein 2